MASRSPVFSPKTLVLMNGIVAEVWAQVAPRHEHLEPDQIVAAQEHIAKTVLLFAGMGVRDPLVLRAMGLGALHALPFSDRQQSVPL